MITLAHSDPEIENYKDVISPYIGGYDARGVPYWVVIEKKKVLGLVVIGEEPLKVIEPLGTKVSVVLIVDYDYPPEIMTNFVKEARRLAIEEGAAYSFVDLPSHHEDVINSFLDLDYQEIADSKRMICELKDNYDEALQIGFVKVERQDLSDYLKKMKEFMSGTPDTMLEIVLSNLGNFPDAFLDHWYQQEQLYYVYDDEKLVGILDLCPKSYASVANLGISPKHRGKGYGRQLITFALKELKDLGKDRAGLRVHAANEVAMQLYKSFGFEEEARYKALIWRNI